MKRFRADDAVWSAGERGPDVVLASDYDALAARVAELERDARRMEWFFGPSDKLLYMQNYLLGIREKWTVDQWRASIDAAMGTPETDLSACGGMEDGGR